MLPVKKIFFLGSDHFYGEHLEICNFPEFSEDDTPATKL